MTSGGFHVKGDDGRTLVASRSLKTGDLVLSIHHGDYPFGGGITIPAHKAKALGSLFDQLNEPPAKEAPKPDVAERSKDEFGAWLESEGLEPL